MSKVVATDSDDADATLHLKMWLTKHTKPPRGVFAQVRNCTLKAFVYQTADVSDGHLAALDMKIGSAIRIKWWNRVSIALTGQKVKPATTALKKKKTGRRRGLWGRGGSDANNDTTFNELVELDAKINPAHAPTTVRLIVHQKAKPDLNERAVAAATVPVSLIPVFEHGAKVTLPLPNSEDGESVSLHDNTPLEIFRGRDRMMHIYASNEDDDDYEEDANDGPSFFTSKLLPGVTSAVSHLSSVVISPLNPFINATRRHSPTAVTPRKQKKAREGSELDLWPQLLPLTTLAAVGQNRLISNGSLKVVMWLETRPTSLLGDEAEDEDSHAPSPLSAPISFPPPLANRIVDEVFPVKFRTLRSAMLSTGSELMREQHKRMKYTSVSVSPWMETGNEADARPNLEIGQRKFDGPLKGGVWRTVTYIMPRSAIMKANNVTETQVITHFSSRGFILEVDTYTPEVPFGETFRTSILYLVEGREDGATWLSISSACAFTGKRPFIAGQIEAGVRKGTNETFVGLRDLIFESVEGPRGKKKRSSRTVKSGDGFFPLRLLLLVLFVGWIWFGFKISGLRGSFDGYSEKLQRTLFAVAINAGKVLVWAAKNTAGGSQARARVEELEKILKGFSF